MGRPLRKETLEKMNLSATKKDGSSVVLGKQVGYNKYLFGEESERNVVRLSNELVNDYDAKLVLLVNGEEQPVLKITKNLFQTAEGIYSYELTEDNEIKFADETVSIGSIETKKYLVNVVRGNMLNNQTYIYDSSKPSLAGSTGASVTSLESGNTTTIPVRVITEPVEIKEGGVIFDADLYDFSGAAYATFLFYDADQNPLEMYEGINGALNTLTSNKIEIDESLSKMSIITSTTTEAYVKVPSTYKYVRAATTLEPEFGIENGGKTIQYHYFEKSETPAVTSLDGGDAATEPTETLDGGDAATTEQEEL